jgi:hypothetical protein
MRTKHPWFLLLSVQSSDLSLWGHVPSGAAIRVVRLAWHASSIQSRNAAWLLLSPEA